MTTSRDLPSEAPTRPVPISSSVAIPRHPTAEPLPATAGLAP